MLPRIRKRKIQIFKDYSYTQEYLRNALKRLPSRTKCLRNYYEDIGNIKAKNEMVTENNIPCQAFLIKQLNIFFQN